MAAKKKVKAAPKPAVKKKAAKKKAKKKTAKKKANGRPTKYKTEYNTQARKLCLLGAIDREIADFFGVSESTLNLWKEKHPSFSESLKDGKGEADAKVVRSLFERATGYNCPETKTASFEGKITDAMNITRHYPPDTTAAIFWLKNRQKDEWRDRHEHTGADGAQLMPAIIEMRPYGGADKTGN